MNKVDVYGHNRKIGTLAISYNNEIIFQYSKDWQANGFSLNPFVLPLSNEVFVSKSQHFNGMFGVFSDSLPDSFGRLLLDRYLLKKGVQSEKISPLEKLCYVGSSGMGFLEYLPSLDAQSTFDNLDFDEIQKEYNKILNFEEVNNIEKLYSLGGSSGGARPKSLIKYKGEDWIIKFSSKYDDKNIAEIEYKYMSKAKKFGINIPNIELLTSEKGNKYFLIKRFDRNKKAKIHMISVAALLECDFNAPSLDYNDLIKLTDILTKSKDDVIEMYKRMVFNVFIDNQDDHAKNFSFLYDEKENRYRLSPAYDITPGKTYYGEHTTFVNGKGKNITEEDMLKVAEKHKINIKTAKNIIEECKQILKEIE